jgi:hypothetical protein
MSTKRLHFVAALALTVFLVGGCSQDKERERIEASFESYKEAVLSKNGSAVAPLVSEGSLEHYDRLQEIALTDASSDFDTLQWVDQMQVLMFRQLLTAEELGARSPQEVVALAFDRKMIGKDLERTSTFDRLEIEGDAATARHIARGVPAGGPEREAHFRWVKEDDKEWRIDLVEVVALIQGHFDDTHRLDFPEVSEEKLAHGIVETFTQRKLQPDHFRPMMAVAADSPSDEAAPSLTADVEAFPPLGSPPIVELVHPGDPPHRALRWNLRKGAKQRLEITRITDARSQVGDRAGPTTRTPSLTYELIVHARSIRPDGKAELELSVADVRVDADQPAPTQLAAQLEGMAESLRGVHGTLTTDARGFLEDLVLLPGPHTGDSTKPVIKLLEDSIGKIQPQLPEQPIGQNAKWIVRETVKESGVTAVRASTYEVAAIDGSLVDIVGTIEQSGQRQTIRPPAAPNKSVEVADSHARGSIEAKLDLASPFPASVRSRSALTMRIDARGADGTASPSSTLSVDTAITVDSREKSP